jgi:hypothetical protein
MKSLTIIIMALVGTLILNGPIQSYADPQLDTLVNIATQARNSLNISISQIPNVPDKITSLYKQGSDETNALTQAANKQDIALAKQHFLSAMNFFKTTNDAINSLNTTEVNDQQRVDVVQLQSEITRLEKIAGTLQTIAITNHADFNFTQLDTSIQNAKQDLDAGKIDDASKLIDSANQLIVDAHQSLSETAQKMTTNRAKDFTEKQIERFDKIDENNATRNAMTQMSNVTISKTSSNVTSIENPGEMIAKLRKLVSEGNVDEALKVIKSLDAYQKGTLTNNENQTESQSQTSVNIQNNAETSSIASQNPSNVTTSSPPITNTLNTTTASPVRINSSHDQNPVPSQNSSNITAANPIKTNSSNNENSGQQDKNRKTDKTNFFHESPNFSSHNPSNVTSSPITNTLNITTTSPVKTNSSNNENSGQQDKNKKTDKTNFSTNNNFNQQSNDNKTVSSVIPQGNSDSGQQDKTHEQKNHGKTPKPKNEKRNHD